MRKKLTIVDKKDNIIGSAYKKEIKEKALNRRMIGILIFNSKKELLIGKRPKHLKKFPGLWTFAAGGKVDEGETYKETALRELKEELGISIKLQEVFKYKFIDSDKSIVFHTIFCGEHESGFKPSPDEVEELKWIKVADLKKDIKNSSEIYTKPFLKGIKIFLNNN